MKKLLISFCFLFFWTPAHAVADFHFKPDQGHVGFQTKSWPNLVTIKGKGQGVTGQLSQKDGKISGQLTFDLTTLDSGIKSRDDHMKATYLEVEKFPQATIVLTEVEFPKDLQGSMKFKALMKLHGQEKEVAGKADLKKDGKDITMTAELPIKLTDFKITIPNYKGITVAENVSVTFESKVTQK